MKLSLIYIVFLFTNSIIAQEFILLKEDSISLVVDDINETVDIVALDLFYSNNTNDAVTINWRRELGDNCPNEWSIASVDPNLSYPPSVNESPQAILVSPNDSNYIMRQEFRTNSIAGCCDVKVIFTLGDNPIDTGYYHLDINTNGCLETFVSEDDIEKHIIYPNPSSSVLNIDNNASIESIQIFDLTGKTYFESTGSVPSVITISHVPSGLYFCQIKNRGGHFTTSKIFKN